MRTRQAWVFILFFCMVIQPLPSGESYPYGISGVESGCTCHSAVATESVIITLDGLPEQYEANETYTLQITTEGGAESIENHTNYGGFNLWISHGILSNLTDEVQVFSDNEVSHTEAGNDQRAWTVNWTAPEDNSTRVQYRLHVNTVNGDGVPSDADQWNRIMGSFGGFPEPQEERVSSLILYGVPIVMLALAALLFSREMNKS